MFLELHYWTLIILLMASFAIFAMLLSAVDWGMFLRTEKKQTWIGITLWMLTSFVMATIFTMGILMIGGAYTT